MRFLFKLLLAGAWAAIAFTQLKAQNCASYHDIFVKYRAIDNSAITKLYLSPVSSITDSVHFVFAEPFPFINTANDCPSDTVAPPTPVQSVTMDFGNGNTAGPFTVPNFNLPTQYYSPGIYELKYTISFLYYVCEGIWVPNTLDLHFVDTLYILSSEPQGTIYDHPDATWTLGPVNYTPDCYGSYSPGDFDYENHPSGANAYIKYANPDHKLRKPFILVEGLDLLTGCFYDESIQEGSNIMRYGGFGWDVMMTGILPVDPTDLSFAEFPRVVEDAVSRGYDLILLDFEDGAGYIQKNALLLEELLIRINSEKVPDPVNGNLHGNVVLGASMGGVMARYTLAKMEKEGTAHCTNLYISFDAPHKGAHIPMGTQAAAWFFEQVAANGNYELPDYAWQGLQRPAARQLLVDNLGWAIYEDRIIQGESTYFVLFGEGNRTRSGVPPPFRDYGCLREQLETELEALGYPQETRNVAIANGSELGVALSFSNSSQIYQSHINALANNTGTIARFDIWALDGLQQHELYDLNGFWGCDPDDISILKFPDIVFHGSIPIIGTCLGFKVPTDFLVDGYSINHNYPHFDNAPGSFRRDIKTIATIMEDILEHNYEGIEFNADSQIDNQSFVPTMSALDIDWEMNDFNLFRTDVRNAINIAHDQNMPISPFEEFHAERASNTAHVQVNEGNRGFTFDQMNLVENSQGKFLTEEYNYGLIRKNIPETEIQNQGKLYVNNIGATGYVFTNPQDAALKQTFHTWVQSCGNGIEIKEGGIMHIGAEDSNVKYGVTHVGAEAVIRIQNGGVLHVKNAESALEIEPNGEVVIESGGVLRASQDGKIFVKEGGRLIIENGAIIDLQTNESTIHIRNKGELHVKGEFRFNTSNGFIQFDEGNELVLHEEFVMTGKHREQRMLRINQGATLHVRDFGIRLSTGSIHYLHGARMLIKGAAQGRLNEPDPTLIHPWGHFNGVIFTGLDLTQNLATAVLAEEPKFIFANECSFQDLYEGIKTNGVKGHNNVYVWLMGTKFYRCIGGLLVEGTPKVQISRGCEWSFYKGVNPSEFPMNFNYAIHLNEVENAYMSDPLVEDYLNPKTPDGGNPAIRLDFVDHCTINDGLLINNFTAVHMTSSNLDLYNGATIEGNTIGIEAFGNQVSGLITMRCARLICNGIGIKGHDAILSINDGNNYFDNCGNEGKKLIELCYDLIPMSVIYGLNNYWSIPDLNVPTVCHMNYGPLACLSSINNIQLKYLPTTQILNCTPGGGGGGNPNWPGINPPGAINWTQVGTTSVKGNVSFNGKSVQISPQYATAEEEWVEETNEEAETRETSDPLFFDVAEVPNSIVDTLHPIFQQMVWASRARIRWAPDDGGLGEKIGNFGLQDGNGIKETLHGFPNPAEHTYTIFMESESNRVEVIDAMGALIYKGEHGDTTQLDVSKWKTGVYFIKVTDLQTGNKQTGRMMIQR